MASDLSLSDLNIVYHSQIPFDELMIPLKIDIAKILEFDFILAHTFANQYKINPIEPQIKELNELDNIKIIHIQGDDLTLSYEALHYKYELELLSEDKRVDYCIKYINTSDKLFDDNTKNLLEYLETDNLRQWLFDRGWDDVFYSELYSTVSYWVDMILKEYVDTVKIVMLLDYKNKDGVVMNSSILTLKACYESMSMRYFKENKDIKCYEELSYREIHLMQSYYTKMNYIDIAINKDAKKQMEERKNTTPSKHKSPAKSKRF